jgi:hypothetical protein
MQKWCKNTIELNLKLNVSPIGNGNLKKNGNMGFDDDL